MTRPISMRVAYLPVLLGFLLTTWACDHDSPTEIVPGNLESELTETAESVHFVYHYSPGDSVQPDRQEAHHEWATGLLGVALPVKIQYYKYRNRDQLARLTGMDTNGWADSGAFAVHYIEGFDHHEVVHLYGSLVGSPPALLGEGLAVALSTDPHRGVYEALWHGRNVHRVAAGLGSQLVPLRDLLTSSDFRRYPPDSSYPQAGSFVRWLLDERGISSLLALYGSLGEGDSRSTVEDAFERIYGPGVPQLEGAWRSFLDSY